LRDQLAAFREGARAGAISLLAAFYFRQAGKIEGEPTFEFTHKSFGEYLTTRRLVRAVKDVHEDRELNRKNRQRGRTVEEALIKWMELTGPTPFDIDLLVSLSREVDLKDRVAVDGWRKSYAELFSDQLNHGLPVHRLQLSTYREMARQARNAEEALLAIHFCCASKVKQRSEIGWPNRYSMRDFLGRTDQGMINIVKSCLGWLQARNQVLFCINLESSNLTETDLMGSELIFARMLGADLTAADLSFATLMAADLRGAQLVGAVLDGTDLEDADLRDTDLKGASLLQTNLDGVNLEGVRKLDQARGISDVSGWVWAKIEHKWVDRLGLDAAKLGLIVVKDIGSHYD
jgi:uncharacterized protein YjbI with pentapeptide repeats